MSVCDQKGLSPDERKERRFSNGLAVALIIIMLLFSLALPLMASTPYEDHTVPATIKYTSHAPINIFGDSQFTPTNGVTGGSGTSSDPYVISGWDISANTMNGIAIHSTSAYFVIRGCNIHDGGLSYGGIYMYACSHGTVSGNTFTDNYDGMALISCNDCTVVSNHCSSNDQSNTCGIYLEISNDNTVHGNNCTDNDFGIYLYQSYNTVISENICASNFYWDGITLDHSNTNTLSNNTCTGNGGEGIYLFFSTNNNLSGNICKSNDYDGIGIDDSSDGNILSNNDCSWNRESGIWLNYSSTNAIVSNQVRNNTWPGIDVDTGSSHNSIWNNTIIGNHGSIGSYDVNHIQASDNGTYNYWNSSTRGNYWSDWTSPDDYAPWRIVDLPYNMSGSASSKDYLPLASLPESSNPVTTATTNGTSVANGWFTSNVSVTLSATDTLSGINETFYRKGVVGNWLHYSSPVVFNLEGNSTVQFYSRDNALNNEAVKTLTIKIDTIAPNITITEANGSTYSKPSVSVNWNITDASSGIKMIEACIDSNASFVAINISKTQASWENLTGGSHYILIRATDAAGNAVVRRLDFKVSLDIIQGIPNWLLLTIIVLAIVVLVSILLLMRARKGKPQVQPPMQQPPIYVSQDFPPPPP